MAHEITQRANGQAEMAFVGKLPWHGLGQRLTEGASIETWKQQAGMDWTVQRAPVQYTAPDGSIRTMTERSVLYRSDTGAPLSVVGADYKEFHPGESLEFFRDLTEAHGFHIHTAGTLQGGRKFWAMAKNGHSIEVAKGDRIRGNLLLASSCDGTMRTTAMFTAVRVVCANTLAIALNGGRDAVSVSHRSHFDADAVKRQLGLLDTAFERFGENMRELVRKHITEQQAGAILAELFARPTKLNPQPASIAADVSRPDDFARLVGGPALVGGKRPEPKAPRVVAPILHLWNGAGRGAEPYKGTAWGLLNAVTEHIDHYAARTDDARMASAWFGKGADVKQECLQLLMKA